MRIAMRSVLALALILGIAATASAQAAGDWQKVHGQVQAIHNNDLSLKTDDGRVLHVDMSQVSESVRGAMAPNVGVTVAGFPGKSPDRFTARYIEQDNAGAAAAPDANATIARILPLVPQFLTSKEFQDRAARFRNDPAAARRFVDGLYEGFFERKSTESERNGWVGYLTQSGDVKGIVESFMRSPEYAGKKKDEGQVITDLYQAIVGRTPTPDEIRNWQQQIAQR